MPKTTTTLVGGLTFPESPRWHDGRLWYLDLPSHSLRAVDLDGRDELVEKFDHRPATFDFLPDGSPVVALQHRMEIIRAGDRSLYADLSELENQGRRFAKFGDLVVDGRGRLYIGCALPREDPAQPWAEFEDAVVLVDTDGSARVVAERCVSPNGIAVSADGSRLILAESMASRLAEWTVATDGSLTDARVFAEVGANVPDGICADAEGAIWVAGLYTREVVRVHGGGRVSESVKADGGRLTIAAMLGGPDKRHLFVLTCQTPNGQLTSWEDVLQATGYIEVIEVGVPGGGWPSN